jgi:two-component system, NarL family, nitrate/nitrite response regulator NarL
MKKMTIILADDHPVFTGGLAGIIDNEPDMEVVTIVHNGTTLLQTLREEEADLIVLDINMPGINGMDLLVKIRQYYPSLKVVMLSTYAEPHLVEKAEKAGADGYVVKSSDIPELLGTLRSVFNGEKSFPVLRKSNVKEDDGFSRQFFLTRREKEIIGLIGQNLTNQQIAEQLCLSIYTVETHRKNIMEKLGIKKPGALMQYILEKGMMPL